MPTTLRISDRDIALSRLGKELFPADHLTKHDVIDYYRDVADVMIPHLAGRPLVLRRYPDGIDADGFVQQAASRHFPDWLAIAEAPRRDGPGSVEHVVCDDAATLVHLANQATIEYHTWLSTTRDLGRPDRLVIDIDPPRGTGVAAVRRVARRLRDLFGSVGLTPFVQATGGRGFHVVAALDGSEDHPLDYAEFEGRIPEGEYGAGTMVVWDRGTYENLREEDVAEGLERGHLTVWLDGEKIRGGFALTHARLRGDDRNWLLVKVDDAEADRRRKPTRTQPESVLSGRVNEDL